MSQKSQEDTSQLTVSYFEDEMKTSYLNYAYSVITSRAIPDVRDGLKPVHRRILYAMSELALWHDKPTRKSARVVGDVLGKYHPHGDASVYMAAVKLAQDFSIRYPLIIGQGNFGSIDDDPPAAMRYTEMKLSKVAEHMLADLNKDTVDFRFNFDDTLKEPIILPGKFPYLLCNGTTGIAVGFATDIPPHNFTEVAAGISAYLDNPDITIRALMKHIKGPDFPTGGMITNGDELQEIYETGHGSIHLAGKMAEEEFRGNPRIVITEIPYRVIKSKLVEDITTLVLDTKSKYSLILKDVNHVRDESSKDGIRVVIDLAKGANVEAIKTTLYNHTAMTTRVKVNMVMLTKNQPRVATLKILIEQYVQHRRDVIIRRTKFELDNAEKRMHIVDGLLIALDAIDEVIHTIRHSKDTPTAKQNLITKFNLTTIQSQAILDLRLQKLTNLEVDKLKKEKEELEKLIMELKSILASGAKRDAIIKADLKEMAKDIKDTRQSGFEKLKIEKIEQEELIENQPIMLTVSRKGFIIREIDRTVKTSSRGSKGRRGDTTDTSRLEQDDYIFTTISGHLKDTILFVTDSGKVYSLKGYEIKGDIDGKITRGHIRNIDRLNTIEQSGERITAVLIAESFKKDAYIVFSTRLGKVAKISLDNFSSIHRNGINGIRLRTNDSVVGAVITDGNMPLFLIKRNAKGFMFDENQLPAHNRGVSGEKGTGVPMSEEEVIGMGVASQEDQELVLITQDGRGKRISMSDFKTYNRGSRGARIAEIGKKRILVDFTLCEVGDILVITTRNGRRISIELDKLGYNLLKLIDVADGDEVSSISSIKKEDEMANYPCIIFDLYNTLIEDDGLPEREQYRLDSIYSLLEKTQYPLSHRKVAEAYKSVLLQIGEQQSLDGRVYSPFEQVDFLLKILKIDDLILFKKIYSVYVDAALQISPRLMKNAKKALDLLKSRNTKIGLISNTGKTPGVILRMLLKELKIYSLFDDMIFSDEFGYAKPDVEIFNHAIRRLGIAKEKTLFIGDLKRHDYDGARTAGLQAHLFNREHDDLFQLALSYSKE